MKKIIFLKYIEQALIVNLFVSNLIIFWVVNIGEHEV